MLLSKPAGPTVLFGTTLSLNAQIVTAHFCADLRRAAGTFARGTERLDQVGIGPRVAFGSGRWTPYTGSNVGFGRYSNGAGALRPTPSYKTPQVLTAN